MSTTDSTADWLEAIYGGRGLQIVRLLTERGPMSGREVAAALVVSPTTAMKALRRLEDQRVVSPTYKGRTSQWWFQRSGPLKLYGALAYCHRPTTVPEFQRLEKMIDTIPEDIRLAVYAADRAQETAKWATGEAVQMMEQWAQSVLDER
jgi:predicted ArsR family transcriptional regulator